MGKSMLSPNSLKFFWAPHPPSNLRVRFLASAEFPFFTLYFEAVSLSSFGTVPTVGTGSLPRFPTPNSWRQLCVVDSSCRFQDNVCHIGGLHGKYAALFSSQFKTENLNSLLYFHQPKVKLSDVLLSHLSYSSSSFTSFLFFLISYAEWFCDLCAVSFQPIQSLYFQSFLNFQNYKSLSF